MDTGHVKQVATFEKLLGFCNAHGAMFNPSKAALRTTALSTLLTSAQQSLEAVKTARTEYINLVNARNEAFNGLPKFMTRIVNTLAACGASQATIDEGYSFIQKFRPADKKKTTVIGDDGLPVVTRTLSQMDFDSQVDNFGAMVMLVSLEPTYQPNEVELQVSSLQSKVEALRSMNTAMINSIVVLSNARARRDTFLYQRNGIHGLALAVKRYVKGVFGFRSVAYNQISSLMFVNRKTR